MAPVEDKLKDDENTEAATARIAKESIVYTGFIAQDVEKTAKAAGYEFSGVDAPKNDNDLYGLRYAEFVVPLVKSVQELSRLNEEKDTRINELQQRIDKLEALVTGKKTPVQNEKVNSAFLEQNNPNPFSNATTIRFTLPVNYTSAKIIITDNTGKLMKELIVSGRGKGSIIVNTASLNAGTYQYALYVNDRLTDSKQMILAK